MDKIDYKKIDKQFYLPKQKPAIVEIPKFKFVTIEEVGNPNSKTFEQVVEALYTFSYKVRMSHKSKDIPKGYYEYVVYPLEGIWDLQIPELGIANKDNFKYKMMIRQPEFLSTELFNRFIDEIKEKKDNIYTDKLKLEEIEEGLSCQMLHLGSYDSEPESFKLMEEFCKDNGYLRSSLIHKEIYLSDPRKTATEKLKTVLRFKAEKI